MDPVLGFAIIAVLLACLDLAARPLYSWIPSQAPAVFHAKTIRSASVGGSLNVADRDLVLVTYEIKNVQPAPSRIKPGLDLTITLRNKGRRAVITDARALLSMQSPTGQEVSVGWAFALGHATHWEVARNGGECELVLTLRLDHLSLRAIEEARANQKARFLIRLVVCGVLIEGEMHVPPTPRVELFHDFTIGKSDWVEEYLPAFGFGAFELLESRSRVTPIPLPLKKEADLLRRAGDDIDRGNFEDAYTDCRKMVESLETREKEWPLEASIGKEEFGRMKHYFSMALHDDSRIAKKIVKADADFALRISNALLLRIAAALEKPEKA